MPDRPDRAHDRVFAGIRATGRQHIGNYLGAIQNFVALQDKYECIYSIVDLHSLTTLTETEQLQQNVRETALDLLAAGIRPEETILYAQSHVRRSPSCTCCSRWSPQSAA